MRLPGVLSTNMSPGSASHRSPGSTAGLYAGQEQNLRGLTIGDFLVDGTAKWKYFFPKTQDSLAYILDLRYKQAISYGEFRVLICFDFELAGTIDRRTWPSDQFDSTGRLIIKSAGPDERWSVTRQHADRETQVVEERQ